MSDYPTPGTLRTRHKRETGGFWAVLGRRESVIVFDFVTPLGLEACQSRVGAMQDLRNLDDWSPQVRVNLNVMDEQTCAFRLTEQQPAPIVITGYLNRLDDGSTYVSGEASARVYLQLGELAFLVALIFVLTVWVGWYVAVLFGPLLMMFVWYTWRGVRKERDRLTAVLRDTLVAGR